MAGGPSRRRAQVLAVVPTATASRNGPPITITTSVVCCSMLLLCLSTTGTQCFTFHALQQQQPHTPITTCRQPSRRNHAHTGDAAVASALSMVATSQLDDANNAPTRTWAQRPGWPPPITKKQRPVEEQQYYQQYHQQHHQQQQQQLAQRRRQKMKPMPIRGYDARAIEEYYDVRPLEVIWRLNSLGFPLLGM